MQFKTVAYQKTFNIGSYESVRIGVELELSPEDTPESALQLARDTVIKFHQETAPLEEMRGMVERDVLPSLDVTILAVIEDLKKCTVIDQKNSFGVQVGLLSYKEMAEKFPDIQKAYDIKFFELTK